MANRTGSYFAFDGLGQTDPTKSDFKYYSIVQGWSAGKHIDFKFVDSHEKTSAVRDTSKLSTLEARIRQRLSVSKNVVVVISDDTRKFGSMLSYEIEKAVDNYELPLIIAYPRYESVLNPASHSGNWPTALATRIYKGSAKAIHIPFKKDAMLDAIVQFTVNGNIPNGSLDFYSRETQTKWGYILNKQKK